jgi:hypothetical protein
MTEKKLNFTNLMKRMRNRLSKNEHRTVIAMTKFMFFFDLARFLSKFFKLPKLLLKISNNRKFLRLIIFKIS